MKMLRIAALVAGVALICAGCGGNYTSPLLAGYHGATVSAAGDSPSPPATPTADEENGLQLSGSPRQDLAQQMADSLAWQIGQWESVSPDCDAKLVFTGAGKTFDCNARWDGISVPFQVSIGGNADPLYSLQVTQLKGLLLAAQVRRSWSERYIEDAFATPSEGNSLTCDSAIPKAVLVPLNAPTSYRCVVAGSVYYAEISMDPFTYTTEYQVVFTKTGP
jgi:hypothetical protein